MTAGALFFCACRHPYYSQVACRIADSHSSQLGLLNADLAAATAALTAPPKDEPFVAAGTGIDFSFNAVVDRVIHHAQSASGEVGTCTLCFEPDFLTGGKFGERTIILCDSCEREFHIGCLQAAGACSLAALPKGQFFCSEACKRVHDVVMGALLRLHSYMACYSTSKGCSGLTAPDTSLLLQKLGAHTSKNFNLFMYARMYIRSTHFNSRGHTRRSSGPGPEAGYACKSGASRLPLHTVFTNCVRCVAAQRCKQ